MKTREEIEELKLQWESDPTWSLCDTEGYEEYCEELLLYEVAKRQQWAADRDAGIDKKAVQLGIPDHRHLVEYIMRLERRIAFLEAVIDGRRA